MAAVPLNLSKISQRLLLLKQRHKSWLVHPEIPVPNHPQKRPTTFLPTPETLRVEAKNVLMGFRNSGEKTTSGMFLKPFFDNGINYKPQLVSKISAIVPPRWDV